MRGAPRTRIVQMASMASSSVVSSGTRHSQGSRVWSMMRTDRPSSPGQMVR